MKRRREYQPKTGERCTCKPGVQRDNCSQCEGTGWCIDFHAIRQAEAQRDQRYATAMYARRMQQGTLDELS